MRERAKLNNNHYNSLFDYSEKISSEWDYDKNKDTPKDVLPFSNKKDILNVLFVMKAILQELKQERRMDVAALNVQNKNKLIV